MVLRKLEKITRTTMQSGVNISIAEISLHANGQGKSDRKTKRKRGRPRKR